MGVWGWGPGENDDAFDVLGSVSWVLDDAWQLLRGDDRTLDSSEIELIDTVSGIVNALGESGISVRPDDDADELSERWADQLSDEAWDALTAEFPRTRPPFDGEGEVERSLREAGAQYEVWMWAAQFGDARAAAWRASERAAIVVALARTGGVSDADLCTALARCLLDYFGPQTDEPYVTAAHILDNLIAARPVLGDTIDTLVKAEAVREAAATGHPIDPRHWLVDTAKQLGAGEVAYVLGGLDRYERHIPKLGALLRPYLDPLVGPRLG